MGPKKSAAKKSLNLNKRHGRPKRSVKSYPNLGNRWIAKTVLQKNEFEQDPLLEMEVEESVEGRPVQDISLESEVELEGFEEEWSMRDKLLVRKKEHIVEHLGEELQLIEKELKSQQKGSSSEVQGCSGYSDEDDLEKLLLDIPVNPVEKRKKIIEEFDTDLLSMKIGLDEDRDDDYALIKRSKLAKLIQKGAKCKKCGVSNFKIERGESKYDLSNPNYLLKCLNPDCAEVSSSRACDMIKLGGENISDIIARFGLVSVDSGVGYDGLASIFSAFNFPVPSKGGISETVNKLLIEIETQGNSILDRCRAVVYKYYQKYFPKSVNDSGKAMIVVCFDGSWKTRGHHSSIAIGFVVDMETKLIVDFHVLSNYCQICTLKKNKLSDEAFKQWVKKHKDNNKCDQNFSEDYSSGSMEPEIASILWERSVNTNLWYGIMVADGDSKSHTKVSNLAPYGDLPIVKEECQNHVSKRMKRALTQLIKEEGLGARKEKKGALTDKKVAAFANFYSAAIKKYVGNVKEMKKAIYASFLHHTQTLNNPTGIHGFCPVGEDSWCFQKKADHKNEEAKAKEFTHHISYKVYQAITESRVFKELTSESFLAKCTGKTQNVNESLHSRVWKLVPKEKYKSFKYVKIAMWLVMVRHNLGIVKQADLVKELSTPTREKHLKKKEKRRVEFKPSESKKLKKLKADKQKKKRGREDYQPGGGDLAV